MVDELFYDECCQIEAYNIRSHPKAPDGGNLVINLKIICAGQFLKGACNLVLDILLAGRFNQVFFYELHGYSIAERFHDVSGLFNGKAPCAFL